MEAVDVFIMSSSIDGIDGRWMKSHLPENDMILVVDDVEWFDKHDFICDCLFGLGSKLSEKFIVVNKITT